MARAVFAGSFDPLTLGHVDLVRRGLAVFGEVVVAIGHNPGKKRALSLEARLAILEAVVVPMGAQAAHYEGLTVDFARSIGATVILRGVRDATDLGFEAPIATANRLMAPEIETVFLPTEPRLAHVSSSLMREIAGAGGDPSAWLPEASWGALRKALGR